MKTTIDHCINKQIASVNYSIGHGNLRMSCDIFCASVFHSIVQIVQKIFEWKNF